MPNTNNSKLNNHYQKYLRDKHSKFRVNKKVIEEAVIKATNSNLIQKKRIIAGESNEVYSVSTKKGKYIIRISRGKKNKFLAENWAINESRKVGVPVPRILLIDTVNKKNEKINLVVENKIAGKPLGEFGTKNQTMKHITTKAGKLLAKIHTVTTNGYGRLQRSGKGEYDNWATYMLEATEKKYIKKLIKVAKESNLPQKNIKLAIKILSNNIDLYEKATPKLIHSDYGPHHILIKNKKINGIIDFANVKGGDPIYDFAVWSYFGKERPPLSWLKKGYESISKLPDNFVLKNRLHRLRLGLNLIPYYDQQNRKTSLKLAKNNLKEDLDYFKKS